VNTSHLLTRSLPHGGEDPFFSRRSVPRFRGGQAAFLRRHNPLGARCVRSFDALDVQAGKRRPPLPGFKGHGHEHGHGRPPKPASHSLPKTGGSRDMHPGGEPTPDHWGPSTCWSTRKLGSQRA